VISSLRMTTLPNPIKPLCDKHHTPLKWAGFVLRRSPEEPPVEAYACAVDCGRVYGVAYGYCDFPTIPITDAPEPYGNRSTILKAGRSGFARGKASMRRCRVSDGR
jgi:hypothetical protein